MLCASPASGGSIKNWVMFEHGASQCVSAVFAGPAQSIRPLVASLKTSSDRQNTMLKMKRLKKILIFTGALIALFVLIYLSIFWTTKYWFSDNYKFGQYTLYTNSKFDNSSEFLEKIDQRLRACELYDEKLEHNIYLFSSERKFKFYATVAGSGYPAQGFNMNAFNKIYISRPFIEQVHSDRKSANKIVPYSAMEGNIEETICHEIIHSFVSSLQLANAK